MYHKAIRKIKRIMLYLIIILILIFFLFPFYWMIVTSFQEETILSRSNPNFIPRDITFENYKTVFSADTKVLRSIGNSLLVAVSVTLVCIFAGSLSAYVFARMKFRKANLIFIIILATQMLPSISLLIPIYLLFRYINLINTLPGLIVLQISFFLPVVTLLLYSYFRALPKELEDSARVDGATRVGTIFKIIMPISWPGLVSAGLIVFIYSMGSFMDAVTLLHTQDLYTFPLALSQFILRAAVGWGPLTAGSIIGVIIPVILVLVFQRFIIKGLTAGAVKE